MTNPIRKTIIFLKKKLNIKEESNLDGAAGGSSSYPINISKPTPGSVLHHEAPGAPSGPFPRTFASLAEAR